MVNVDLSNIWCSVSLPDLLGSEQEIAAAHAALAEGSDVPAWLSGDWEPELARLKEAAQTIRGCAQTLVVVGGDSAAAGVRALDELLRSRSDRLEILFAGDHLSTRSWQALAAHLEGRDFCVHLLGRTGREIQTAATIRSLRWLLERRYGTEKARERVFVTTDPEKGFLRRLSAEEGYWTFNLPRTLGSYACPLNPGALLALAAAGIDVGKILEGAAAAENALRIRSFENPAWLYAAARHILWQRGRRVEYLSAGEPDAGGLVRWWSRLFAARGCLSGQGLMPAAAEIPGDVQAFTGFLTEGAAPAVQTVLRFDPPAQKVPVEMDWKNLDGLNVLEGYTLDYVQEQALAGAVQAGYDGGVPVIAVDAGGLDPESLGSLLYFCELSSCLCAGLLGRDVYEDTEEAPALRAMAALLENAGG